MSTFGEVLAEFKAKESDFVENIAPLIDDPGLRHGITAWKSVVVTFMNKGECPCKDQASRWNWMWDCVQFDSATFGVVAGVRQQDVPALLQRLRGLRLIYPDGTINAMAKNYLQSQIMAKLTGKRPGRPPKEKAE